MKLCITVEKEDGEYTGGKCSIEIYLTKYAVSLLFSSSLFTPTFENFLKLTILILCLTFNNCIL